MHTGLIKLSKEQICLSFAYFKTCLKKQNNEILYFFPNVLKHKFKKIKENWLNFKASAILDFAQVNQHPRAKNLKKKCCLLNLPVLQTCSSHKNIPSQISLFTDDLEEV